MIKADDIKRFIGCKMANTSLGITIISHSYVHESYEWYRSLIYSSEYSLDEIRRLIRKDDREKRSNWLFSRSHHTEMHCTDDELQELITYFSDDDDDEYMINHDNAIDDIENTIDDVDIK